MRAILKSLESRNRYNRSSSFSFKHRPRRVTMKGKEGNPEVPEQDNVDPLKPLQVTVVGGGPGGVYSAFR